jgi:hypothetical protein
MGGPPSPKEKVGRPHAGYPESENSLLRSSSLGHRNWLAVRPRELRLPSPDGLHSIWFTNVSAVSLVESRINLLHCTLPRYCNVDETRDWFRLSNSKAINFSNRRRHYKKLFSFAQEAATYPLRHTLRTFSTVNSSARVISSAARVESCSHIRRTRLSTSPPQKKRAPTRAPLSRHLLAPSP